MNANPHIKYTNNRDHGYILLTLTPTTVKSDWYYVETIRTEGSAEAKAKSMMVRKGSTSITEVED
jgi:alkaline phosphatase D